MGNSNGTYVPWHEPVWSHAKTKAAASVLTAHPKAMVPTQYAQAVVGRALHALSCWAIRDGDTGSTARLTDAELAQIAWPEGVAWGRLRPTALGALLRQALHAGGFLEMFNGEERIHDFQDHNRRVLADREYRRLKATQKAAHKADNRPTVVRQSADTRPPIGPTRARQAQEAQEAQEACTAAHALTPSDEHGYATTPTSPQVEPPTGRSLRLPDQPAPDPDDPQEAQGRAAHRLELTLGCSYSEASKAIQSLVIAGATMEWINARIIASRGSTSTPWDWALHAKRAWADAFGEGAHIA